MKRFFLSVAMIISFSVVAFAQNKSIQYYDSPGFIAIGASTFYTYGGTHKDTVLRPFITGMWSAIRSKYGSLGFSISGIYSTPYRDYYTNYRVRYQISSPYRNFYANYRVNYQISSRQYTGDFSLNYIKNIKMINIWLGVGLNLNYLESQIRHMENSETKSRAAYEKNFYQSVYGYHYQIGVEHFFTKNGSWGMFAFVRGQYTSRAEFNIDRRLARYSDGAIRYIRKERRTMDLSNDLYSVGITYHF